MKISSLLIFAGLLVAPICGCDALGGKNDSKSQSKSVDDDDDDDDNKKKKKKKKSDKDDDKDDDEKDTDDDAKAGADEAPDEVELPAGRSKMPTLAEWAAMKEVTVKGSSALNCETKMVREYLRVSCRGKNDTGGTPTSVQILSGGREGLTFAAGDVTSLVIPFVEGIDADVLFSWTDKAHPLQLKWPRGAPKPEVIGVFEGARSPLDGTSEEATIFARLCECHTKIRRTDCSELFGGANPHCFATFKNNCEKLLECSRGEPSAMPRCPSDTLRMGTGHTCATICGPGKKCKAPTQCTDIGLSSSVCI